MRLEIKSAKEMSVSEQARRDCVVISSLYAYLTGTKWATPDWTVMIWEDTDLVTNVHIVERTAMVGGKPVKLGGIGNIATKVEWRNRGYASMALKKAQEFLSDPLKVDFGLMTSIELLVSRYERMGWKVVAQDLQMEQPDGKMTLRYPIMVLPVCMQEWPAGEIDICGLPW